MKSWSRYTILSFNSWKVGLPISSELFDELAEENSYFKI